MPSQRDQVNSRKTETILRSAIQRALAAKVDTDSSIHRAINEIPDSKDFPASLDTMSGVFANNHDGKLYTIDGFGLSVISERPKQLFARQSLTLNMKSVPTISLQRHIDADDLQILVGTKLLANRGSTSAAIKLTGNSQSFLRILKSLADTYGTCATGARLVFAETAIPCAENVSALVIVSSSKCDHLPEHWAVWTLPAPTNIRTESDMIHWLVAGALCQRPVFAPSRSPPAMPNTLPTCSAPITPLPSQPQETGTVNILPIVAEKPDDSTMAKKTFCCQCTSTTLPHYLKPCLKSLTTTSGKQTAVTQFCDASSCLHSQNNSNNTTKRIRRYAPFSSRRS